LSTHLCVDEDARVADPSKSVPPRCQPSKLAVGFVELLRHAALSLVGKSHPMNPSSHFDRSVA